MSKKNDSLIKIWCILFTGAEPCSLDATLHYSWDFAQCVHYPHHAMHVGPMLSTLRHQESAMCLRCALKEQVCYCKFWF